MGAGEQHTVHKNSLLHLIGERDMGQNDPPRSDELSVTKRQRYVLSKNVVLVKKTHTTQTGYLYRRIKPRGHRVHADIYPANAVAGYTY